MKAQWITKRIFCGVSQWARVSCKNNDVSERRQFYCPKTRTSAKDRAKVVTMLQHTTNKMDETQADKLAIEIEGTCFVVLCTIYYHRICSRTVSWLPCTKYISPNICTNKAMYILHTFI